MSKKTLSKKIIIFEIALFIVATASFLLNELLNIPRLFFDLPSGHLIIIESVFETLLMAVLCIITVKITLRLINQIKYLEGLLPICSYCKKIRVDKNWVQIEDYISSHSEADFTHGICPDCAEKYHGIKL